jgi:hypothetical protein
MDTRIKQKYKKAGVTTINKCAKQKINSPTVRIIGNLKIAQEKLITGVPENSYSQFKSYIEF